MQPLYFLFSCLELGYSLVDLLILASYDLLSLLLESFRFCLKRGVLAFELLDGELVHLSLLLCFCHLGFEIKHELPKLLLGEEGSPRRLRTGWLLSFLFLRAFPFGMLFAANYALQRSGY